MRHSQMVNVAKHALSSKVFSPLFTQARKLLHEYFLFLLSIFIGKSATSGRGKRMLQHHTISAPAFLRVQSENVYFHRLRTQNLG